VVHGLANAQQLLKDIDTEMEGSTARKNAQSKLDKAVVKGVLHTNAAARKKSQFTKKLNAMN